MVCDDQWANPPMSCDVYEGQKGCVIPFLVLIVFRTSNILIL